MSLKRKVKKDVLVSKSAATEKVAGQPLSEDPSTAERRLSNIRPREVSLVDSAANGRTFLLVKRKDAMNKKDKSILKDEDEIKPDEAAEQKPADGADETPAAEGESKPEGSADAGESKPEEGADATAETGEQEAEEEMPEEQIEKHFQTQADEILQQVPVSKALAMEQKEMFLAMSDAMMSVAMTLDFIRSDIMAFAGSDGKTGFMGEEIVKGLSKEQIEKRGRKMKKSRMEKLRSAVDSLSSLLKELEDEPENVNKEVAVKTTDDKKVDKAEESAAAGNAPEGKASETETKKEEAQTEQKVLTQADIDAAVEKATKPLMEKIEKLEGAPADSAAESADESEGEETNKSEKETKKSLFSNIIY